MYGQVNRGIEGLVRKQFGDDAWTRICARAGVDGTGCVAMDTYDDAVTYGLVGAASAELGLDPADVLEAFGEFWTSYTLEEGYSDLLSMMGGNLDEFLDNLDTMHVRIGGTMPKLVPPSVQREPQDDGSSILHYRSTRDGLAPMVIGLIKGLAKRFGIEGEIEHLEAVDDGHQRFHIREVTD